MRNLIATVTTVLLLFAFQLVVFGQDETTLPAPDRLLLQESAARVESGGASVLQRAIVFTADEDPEGSEITDRPVVVSRSDYSTLWLGAIFSLPAGTSATFTFRIYVQAGCREPSVPTSSSPISGPAEGVIAAGLDLTQYPDLLLGYTLSYKIFNSLDSSTTACVDYQVVS